MEDILRVNFEGGRRFTSEFTYLPVTVPSDQRPEAGGKGSAPEPFQLFMASIASCAAVFIQGFCDRKGIDWKKTQLKLKGEWNEDLRMFDKLCFEVTSEEALSDEEKAFMESAIRKSSVYRQISTPLAWEVAFTTSK